MNNFSIEDFNHSINKDAPPVGLSLALQGLWHDAKGDWDKAHECAQNQDGQNGAWVHAYLHRKEGDLGNAAYWYRIANKPVQTKSLEAEWNEIAASLLKNND